MQVAKTCCCRNRTSQVRQPVSTTRKSPSGRNREVCSERTSPRSDDDNNIPATATTLQPPSRSPSIVIVADASEIISERDGNVYALGSSKESPGGRSCEAESLDIDASSGVERLMANSCVVEDEEERTAAGVDSESGCCSLSPSPTIPVSASNDEEAAVKRVSPLSSPGVDYSDATAAASVVVGRANAVDVVSTQGSSPNAARNTKQPSDIASSENLRRQRCEIADAQQNTFSAVSSGLHAGSKAFNPFPKQYAIAHRRRTTNGVRLGLYAAPPPDGDKPSVLKSR
jgi:hypothetical protein